MRRVPNGENRVLHCYALQRRVADDRCHELMTSIIVLVRLSQAYTKINIIQWVVAFLFRCKCTPGNGVSNAQIVVCGVVFELTSVALSSGPIVSAYLNDKMFRPDKHKRIVNVGSFRLGSGVRRFNLDNLDRRMELYNASMQPYGHPKPSRSFAFSSIRALSSRPFVRAIPAML